MRIFRQNTPHSSTESLISQASPDEFESAGKQYDPTELGRLLLEKKTFYHNPEGLRKEFHIAMIELADKFDSLDHKYGPMGGTELQDDCHVVRALARALSAQISIDKSTVETTAREIAPGPHLRLVE
ncbi:MAG: hypothetical protein QFB86_00005 [Patescibacteria group bacterium]|nr:hypothetical protein [Patescibacteria group bacterium]